MAERKSLGLFKNGKKYFEGKVGQDIKVLEKEHVMQAYKPPFTLGEMKKLIESLGGDTSWIEKIPRRESELREKIKKLQEEIERYRDELYKIGLLKKALGI
ncbi:MAG: hypothetical protein DRJ64_03865 [Thermoprotei archaeon]|nr:MAG: hypothetical protein B6U94_03430 [Thermofilum sp. ex4484_79]RLF07024.1 MAG: hypothetical protein DRJ64_03865 [Thermoprotei archaeon]